MFAEQTFVIFKIYLFTRESAGARGGMGLGEKQTTPEPEAQCGARSQDPEIMT